MPVGLCSLEMEDRLDLETQSLQVRKKRGEVLPSPATTWWYPVLQGTRQEKSKPSDQGEKWDT